MTSPRVVFPDIAHNRLEAFQDPIVLRDPRARTRRPGLIQGARALTVNGPFSIRRQLVVTRARGVRFADATGDPNPIHREGEVVPGAFVAAQIVSAAEILLPRLRLDRLRVSFTDVCWYDRPLRLTLRGEPTDDGIVFHSTVWQDRREVASATLAGCVLETVPRLELPLAKVDAAWLLRVVEFYGALGIDAERYFHKEAGPDLSYPTAFLASLPSGSMVERFSGEGGLLNRLTLEFDAKLPLKGPPVVSIEMPDKLRASFNRILTLVKAGVTTAVQGTALVLAKPPRDLLTRD